MVKVVSIEEMRAVERATDAAGISYAAMMQRAGAAVAEVVNRLVEELPAAQVLVLVGPGNNGGDGLVAARILAEHSAAAVDAYLFAPRDQDDDVYVAALEAGVGISGAAADDDWQELQELAAGADVIVDAVLGTGARLPIEGSFKAALEAVAEAIRFDEDGPWDETGVVWPAMPLPAVESGPVIVAVDSPSGLDADTGALDPVALPADLTVTFGAAKYGQLAFPGADAVGSLIVADIGVPPDLPELSAVQTELATGEEVRGLLPARPRSSHKGTYGTVLAIGGSVTYVGAVALLGEAAYRVGAGLVTLAVPGTIYPMLASRLREATWVLLPQDMGVVSSSALQVLRDDMPGDTRAILLGPGLGQEEATAAFIRGMFRGGEQAKRGKLGFASSPIAGAEAEVHGFEFPAPLVIDADGLNNLAKIDEWWTLLPSGTILTPHPGEMGRLAGIDTAEVEADRFGIALAKAAEWNCIVVLKGAHTLIASPEGRLVAMPFATDALATAGTGDVLSGCIVGLLAQGLEPFDAALVGAYVHGLAGQLAGEDLSARSTIAGDVLDMIPEALSLLEPDVL